MKKTNKKVNKPKKPDLDPKESGKPQASAQKKAKRKVLEDKVSQKISELKESDRKLKQSSEREKAAEEQIRIRNKAMDSTSDGIFIIDAQKDNFPVIYANASFLNIIGFRKNEVIDQDYFHLYGPDADSRVLNEIRKSMRLGKPFHGELLNFKKNKKKFWSLLRIAPVHDRKGAVTHYVGIQTDTTEIKQKNMEIDEQREELLHVTRVGKLAEFVSSLAHEISQPLTAILSYAQAAQRLYADREPELQDILQYIINDDQRASEVIKRLRLLLKKSKPIIEPIDINLLITETARLLQTHITVRHIDISFELEDELPVINGDRIQLQQVLLNLISNSLEAMEANQKSRKLLISTSRKNAKLILVEVRDSGSGILSKDMNKVFTHFFTSKENGLGMGLPISRSIIEAHGGRLNVDNNTKRGVTFNFTLPSTEKGSDE